MPDSEKPYREPRLSLNRIYTRQGDSGQTRLVGGQPVSKDSPRIECFGAVDELNALIGVALVTAREASRRETRLMELVGSLGRVQHELFNLGSILATLPEDVGPAQPRVTAADIELLEQEIDKANQVLPALKSFVLPGGSRLDAELHVCRTVCRRVERLAVALSRTEPVPEDAIRYLNRLSDALFVWSRWANWAMGAGEALWDPNRSTGGS